MKISAAVGVPAAERGEEDIVVFVEAHAGASIDTNELLAFLQDRLAAYKRPRKVIPVAVMPLTTNGKIRKHELKARWINAELGESR